MTPVEAVARGICRQHQIEKYGNQLWRDGQLDLMVHEYWPRYANRARAAIAAMREPSEEMIQNALAKIDDRSYDVTKGYINRDDVLTGYQAAIDEALK